MFDIYWYDYDDCDDIKELIAKAIATSRTDYIWLCHLAVDYSQFNLRYLPNRHQAKMMHAWASHDNPDCFTTWLISIENNGDTLFHKDILPILYPAIGKWEWKKDPLIDYSNFNFNWFPSVWDWQLNHEFTMLGKERLSYTTLDRGSNNIKYHAANLTYSGTYYDICCIDTNTHTLPKHDYKVRLVTTMEEAVKSAIKRATKPWLWIVSDTCNYDEFDFDWLPEEGEERQIHCWPSGTCEKGDTFLIHVPSYLGDWNPSYNFNHEPVKRKLWPSQKITHDSLAQELNATPRLSSIYTVYSHTGFADYPDVCLWDKRPAVSINKNNSTTLVPRDCIVKDELYEYPHLLRYPDYGFDALNDIIFISYDEPEADANWNKLVNKFPHAKRVHGVSGMENALKAAATASETPYFYAVFAKTIIHPTFNFDIGSDYWQKPKHYIFYSENTVNGLRYGHMGIVLYNRDMVINAPPFGEFGTDYTLSFAHEVVPIVSCYGSFDASPYHTWRTAFREAHKLREFTDTMPNVETQYRLHIWRTVANGNYAEWALKGANDGVKYYEDNIDTPELRRNTFRWEWLRNHFIELYGDVQ